MRRNGLEEEIYRVPKVRDRRGLADEVFKFALCFALSDHDRALGARAGRRTHSDMDARHIKAGILGERVRAGDEIEGYGIIANFAAIYSPLAYYPSYFLGEIKAELREGAGAPPASPNYLPVSELPPFADGSRISFLFPPEKTAYTRSDLPGNIRDVLTRDYANIPLVRGSEQRLAGRVRFRARLRKLSSESMVQLAGVGERSYESFAARGLTHFLEPLEVVATGKPSGLRGSLFAEMRVPGNTDWDSVVPILEESIYRAVEAVFPSCERGECVEIPCYLPETGHQVVRFRRRLFGLVYDPVFALFRSPDLLGLYLPCDLFEGMEATASLFERFVEDVAKAVEKDLELGMPLKVEIAYDNRLSWARMREAMRGESFRKVGQMYPVLEPTLEWLGS